MITITRHMIDVIKIPSNILIRAFSGEGAMIVVS
jgi:hypothetical protein